MAFRRSGDEAAAMEIENDPTARRRLRHNPLAANGADQDRLHIDAGLHRSETGPKLFDVFAQLFDARGRIERGLAPRQRGTATEGTRPIHHTGAAPNSITTTAPPVFSEETVAPNRNRPLTQPTLQERHTLENHFLNRWWKKRKRLQGDSLTASCAKRLNL
jgi:hypothetical protein